MNNKYLLMHANMPVMLFDCKKDKFTVLEIYDDWHLPYYLHRDAESGALLKEWFYSRSICLSKNNISLLLEAASCSSIIELIIKNYALSLTDCYWIKEETSRLTWKDVNFYENGYSENVGDILIRGKNLAFEPSPDITTNGVQNKGWRRRRGKDYLFKIGSAPLYQEPLNEVISSMLGPCFPELNVVQYHLTEVDSIPCCVCERFTSETKEFVPAAHIYNANEDICGDSHLYIVQKMSSLGVRKVNHFLEDMMIFDYLNGNMDRRLYNYGFIRDVETGDFISPAPLFDNHGWFGPEIALNGANKTCFPVNEPLLQYIGHLERVDLNMFSKLSEAIKDKITLKYGAEIANASVQAYLARIENLKILQCQFLEIEYEKPQKESIEK